MTLVNLTPHDIVLAHASGERTTLPPSGTVARVAVEYVPVPGWHRGNCALPVVRPHYGEVAGLPPPGEDTVYIVSGLVLSRCAGRTDVVGPDTGPTAVRDDGGRIVAVTRLVAAPPARLTRM